MCDLKARHHISLVILRPKFDLRRALGPIILNMCPQLMCDLKARHHISLVILRPKFDLRRALGPIILNMCPQLMCDLKARHHISLVILRPKFDLRRALGPIVLNVLGFQSIFPTSAGWGSRYALIHADGGHRPRPPSIYSIVFKASLVEASAKRNTGPAPQMLFQGFPYVLHQDGPS